MASPTIEILPYSAESLAHLLENTYTPLPSILQKNQVRYLDNYFSNEGIKAKTIIVESDYISKDYLHDYSHYYTFCFEQYAKRCKRIHFFSSSLDQETFIRLSVENPNETDLLQQSYLGFIVVRPIPHRVIGYTLLKTYNTSKDRNFWGVRDYEVHLYGNRFQLSSLAFQEQDTAVAACATTAVWVALNKAAANYPVQVSSPSQITLNAGNGQDGHRLFPNKGLSIQQIAKTFEKAGLVCEIKKGDILRNNEKRVSHLYLKKLVHAYAPLGIPLILAMKVPNQLAWGHHAVPICGHRAEVSVEQPPTPEVSYQASSIQKLYAHDDQHGPFVRMELLPDDQILTPWNQESESAYATHLIIPLYPKVRIAYEDIEVLVLAFNEIVYHYIGRRLIHDLVWDIQIIFSESFKEYIKETDLSEEKKMNILMMSLPKYVWKVSCCIEGQQVFDFVFDATDLSDNMLGLCACCYLPDDLKKSFANYLTQYRSQLQRLIPSKNAVRYFSFFEQSLKDTPLV